MAQWIRVVLAYKPDDLNSKFLVSHDGRGPNFGKLSSDLYMYAVTFASQISFSPYTQFFFKMLKNINKN